MDHPTDPTPNPAPAPSSGRALRAALAGVAPLDDDFEDDVRAATDVLTDSSADEGPSP